ncbi:MAG: SEC-C metal-binding domain-containing protein [Lachnospiraceae bacterium]|nr:SEC-C metal-binding domain-containing protein [Lachnospiraceae bacterium]
MSLIKQWRDIAYSDTADKGELKKLWADYFEYEKGVYKEILKKPGKAISGTVKELAERFELNILTMAGILDGMNDSLKKPNPLDELTEDTKVSMGIDKEKLYKNMVAAGADWLYELPEWEDVLDEERRKELYREQKLSATVVKGEKTYPNDPCTCASGKKYKKCCGRN